MKSFFILMLSTLLLSLPTFAHEHSEELCSSLNPAVCAHLGFLTPLNSTSEGEFMVHVTDPTPVQNLEVELWMEMEGGHGHGSAPVEWKAVGSNRFHVTNVWFVMLGVWQVRVSFDRPSENGMQRHHLSFPVMIKE